jgi:hypothetical protein
MNASPGGRDAAIARAKAAAELEGKSLTVEQHKSLQQGCATTLVAALDPSIDSLSGAYIWNGNPCDDQPWTAEEDQDKLWALSEKLISESFEL